MREEKEIREALKRLKDEHLRRTEDPKCPISGSTHLMIGVILALEWVLGDKQRLPDFV